MDMDPRDQPTQTGTETGPQLVKTALADMLKAQQFDMAVVKTVENGIDEGLSITTMVGILELRIFALKLTSYQSMLEAIIQNAIKRAQAPQPETDEPGQPS